MYSDEILDFYFFFIKENGGVTEQSVKNIKPPGALVNGDDIIRNIIRGELINHYYLVANDPKVGFVITEKGKNFKGFVEKSKLKRRREFIIYVTSIIACIAAILACVIPFLISKTENQIKESNKKVVKLESIDTTKKAALPLVDTLSIDSL